MKKVLLATVAVFTFATSQANAANFSGAFLGLNLGFTSGDVEVGVDATPLIAGAVLSGEEGLDGFEGGAFLGYRHRFSNNFVLGAEAGFLLSGADGGFENILGVDVDYNYEKKNEMYISLKPGYAISDRSLVYLIGGLQRSSFEDNLIVTGTSAGSDDEDFTGYHFGAGFEYVPWENLSMRLEYKRNEYDSESFSDPAVADYNYDGDENTFRLGLTYNFAPPSE